MWVRDQVNSSCAGWHKSDDNNKFFERNLWEKEFQISYISGF